jgi:AcrR family transcriptional regulator
MVRTARFTEDDFIEAAMALVAEGGPAAATMQAIARRTGAPTGSIYHRFDSRSAVLAAAWNGAYAGFTAALGPLLRQRQAREAALAILPWAAAHPRRAAFLLLHDPVSLFEDSPPPPAQRQALEALEQDFDAAFRACIAPAADEESLARARFLVFDAPIAILRPALSRAAPPPPHAARMIAELHAGMTLAA